MRVACSGSFTDAITNTLEIAIGGGYSARLDLKPVTSHVNRARCTPRVGQAISTIAEGAARNVICPPASRSA
jgi:hypothetical protein